jgi:glycosyltransferase involved in cell wall biosynthesis
MVESGTERRDMAIQDSGAHGKGIFLRDQPIKRALNGRFLAQGLTGVQRYAREILKALDSLNRAGSAGPNLDLSVLAPPDASLDLPLPSIPIRRVGRLRGQLWEQVDLPRHARGSLLIGLCNSGPLLHPRQIVALHDAAVFDVPAAYSPAYRAWARFRMRRLGRRAVRVITVSSFSRERLAARLGIDPARIGLVPPGTDHVNSIPSDDSILARLGLGDRRFFLAVGSRSPAKNFGGLLEAYRRLGPGAPPLVLVGGRNPRIFPGDDLRSSEGVVEAGYVDDGGLRCLYGKAAALCCPSFHEGFGLPPLEAMACGCPVVASRAAALPEACGDAALYCDPGDPVDIARALRRILDDDALREDLRRRGLERAGRYRWESSARALLGEIRGFAEGPAVPSCGISTPN